MTTSQGTARASASSVRTSSIATASSSLYRLSGLSVVAGSALMAIGDVMRVISGPDPAGLLLAIGWFGQAAGAAVAVVGLPGFGAGFGRLTGRLGVAGLVGIAIFLFYFGVFGGLLHALAVPGLVKQGATRPHPVDIGFIVAAIFAMLGSVALGVASFRARFLSPGVPLLLMVGGVALVAGHPFAHVEDGGLLLLLGGLSWAGYQLAVRSRP